MQQYHMRLPQITIAIVFGMALNLSAQNPIQPPPEIGVYITVKFKKKCENQVTNADNKKFCLAPLPVLTSADISYITEMKLDLLSQPFFNLVFTEAGATKLRNLSKAFPDTEIALVVDSVVIGFLVDLDLLKSNMLKMTAARGSTTSIDWVHAKLATALPVRK
jgi:hypothetical protein